jgi:glucose/arabinose dehydrogenase
MGSAISTPAGTAPVREPAQAVDTASSGDPTVQAELATAAAPTAADNAVATPTTGTTGPLSLALRQVAQGFQQPTFATHAGDGSGRMFVVEKAGRIRILRGNAVDEQPFLDITDRVGSSGSEQGLFAVAFHPNYRTNGQFFVNYTDENGDTVIARFRVSNDPDRADVGSAATLLRIDQPEANHNGGQIAFGPDGYLYIGMGDGGGAGDRHGPIGNGQNGEALLGKILRIDVNGQAPYGIPPHNPFVGRAGMRPEIWATGMRNPWRFSFDRATGDLFIADVGQNETEEIDFEPARSPGGRNYGWNVMEGSGCFRPTSGCDQSNKELPVAEYNHDQGCSVTGGYRYRGRAEPSFVGVYFFADYCSGRIWGLTPAQNGAWTKTELFQADSGISSFGEDEQGELYVMDLSTGVLSRLVSSGG